MRLRRDIKRDKTEFLIPLSNAMFYKTNKLRIFPSKIKRPSLTCSRRSVSVKLDFSQTNDARRRKSQLNWKKYSRAREICQSGQ